MGYKLYRSLVEQQVIAPYLQNSFRSLDNWPSVDKLRIEHPGRHDSHEDDYFHPSVHADECELGCYLRLHPVERRKLKPEKPSFTSVMTPLMGSVVHTIVQQKLLADDLITEDDIEIPLVDEERHWRGHADLRFKGVLVDIKTMRAEKFKFLSAALPYWQSQLNPYMDKMGLDTSVVLVIEMGWPFALKEFRINKSNKILNEIYNKWASVTEAIQADIPPSHDGCERRYCTVRERYDGEL